MRTRTLALLVVVTCTSCMGWVDMLARDKTLVGPYTLFRTEFGTFSLGGPGKPAGEAGGYIDGTVDSLGWSSTRLLAWRGQPTFGGDRPGWMVIDLTNGSVTGPLDAGSRARDSALARIPVQSASVFWQR